MHFAPRADDPLHHLNGLGYAWAIPLAVGAAEAMMDEGAAETDPGGAGLPGAEPSVPRQPGAVTTISPTIQAQISPQISPTMVQQQSSPGATVGASPTQYMPGGLQAEHAVSPYGNWAAPGTPSGLPGTPTGSGISPLQPYTLDPMTGQFSPTTVQRAGGAYSPVTVGEARMTDIPWMPIALVGGAVAIAMMMGKRKPRATT